MRHLTSFTPFWDDSLIDWEKTDATLSANKPRKAGVVLSLDKQWEGNSTDFFTIVKEDGFYRMYYEAWSNDEWYGKGQLCIHVCYAESKDGKVWERPVLNMVEDNGSTENNIIIHKIPDNFTVMKDDNPSCPPEMRYKAVMSMLDIDYTSGNRSNVLAMMVSEDGIHFKHHSIISKGLAYDTQNTLHYDKNRGKYFCYMRAYDRVDTPKDPRFNEERVRLIAVMESEDLMNWSKAERLNFGDRETYPLYTNCVSAYPYDDRYYIGFPTRYVERKEWTQNYDHLCGKELRKERMGVEKRLGLALSDCVFMSSTDHKNWYRFEEAIITPGLENGNNWVYGDCFPAVGGVVATKSDVEGEPDELSIYVFENHWMNVPTVLTRYVYRRDGFASVKADYKGKKLVTKPFTFEGDSLYLNFSTSARGGINVKFLDEDGNVLEGYESCEIFGDSVSRRIDFESDLSKLKGRAVRLEFDIKDAEIYAMTFAG
jgi:hypothetical protein